MAASDAQRSNLIISALDVAFAPLMKAHPVAFRAKYRKMAADPHAFYRGSACLFYADVTDAEDPYADDRSGRIWIHGDLHVENFGTYLNSDGRLVFDVNDFDEAYLGRFTWDLQRFAASLALVGWQKALPEEEVRRLIGRYTRSYLSQVNHYRSSENDDDFAPHLDNTHGPIKEALTAARCRKRADLLDASTELTDGVRRFRETGSVRRLSKTERAKVVAAFEAYLETIPDDKRFDRELFYDLRDLAEVVDLLGRATAKVHCASDEDSEQDLVDFQVEEALAASLDGRRREFTAWLTDFGVAYADRVRKDHTLFVEAFREGRIGVSAT